MEAVAVQLIDCDVHIGPRGYDELLEYVPEPWKSRTGAAGLMLARPAYFPFWDGNRLDSYAGDGSPAGSDSDVLKRQLLVEAGVDFAILDLPAG